jgi:diguanylate cyclase (GGDEF)-like protein
VGNRRVAYDRLARDAKACRQGGNPVSVLYIDIDFFKNVNDEFGHAVGDEVLIAIARTLSVGLRSGDTLCRIGGEEFLAILNDCDAVAAFRTGERLRASVAGQIFVRVGRPVTVSIGVATLICGESDEDLIRRADEALLEAKRAGRNRVCRWMPAVEAAV